MKKFTGICLLILLQAAPGFSQTDARSILEKSFMRCLSLSGGSYRMEVTKKTFSAQQPFTVSAECKYLKVEGDSAAPYKFFVRLGNGDATLCTSNDLVILQGSDSTGTIYSRSTTQSNYQSASQSEGLFPPFFQPRVVFSLDRLEQTTFIVRQGNDETVLGKPCYSLRLIDLVRASLPGGQRQEKHLLIDKQTFLPMFYSEKSVISLSNDSSTRENTYRFTEISMDIPHDSMFTYKNIPSAYRLKNSLGTVYHHHLKTGIAAPPFTAKLFGADSVSLKTFSGKKILLCFFSRTSYPSLKSLNAVQRLKDKNPAAEILLVAVDAPEPTMSELLSKRNLSIRTLVNAQHVADRYYITSAPTFIVVDPKGIVQWMESGFGDGTEVSLQDQLGF